MVKPKVELVVVSSLILKHSYMNTLHLKNTVTIMILITLSVRTYAGVGG